MRMTQLAQFAGVILVTSAFSAASEEANLVFPTQQANSGQTGVADLAPVTKPRLKWKMQIPTLLSHQSVQPVLGSDGKSLYFTAGGSLFMAEVETGKILAQVKGSLTGHPSITAGTLYATGTDFLRAYDISGETISEKWTCKVPNAFESASKYNHAHRSGPSISAQLALFGQGSPVVANTKLFAADLASGKIIWTFEAKAPLRSLVAVNMAHNLGFLGSSGSGLFAVDLATGKEKWHLDLQGTQFSGPSVADDTVYCGSENELAAVRALDGTIVWRVKRKTPGGARRPIGRSAIISKDLVVVNTGPFIEAYDRKDGACKWQYTAAGEGAGFMVAARGVLYVPDFSSVGFLHAISLKDGEKLWVHQAPDGRHKCDYAGVSAGCVYYSSLGGYLYCLENDH